MLGLIFENSSARLQVWEDHQSVEFRFRTDPDHKRPLCQGRIHFWLSGVILADINLSILIVEESAPENANWRRRTLAPTGWSFRHIPTKTQKSWIDWNPTLRHSATNTCEMSAGCARDSGGIRNSIASSRGRISSNCSGPIGHRNQCSLRMNGVMPFSNANPAPIPIL